MATPLPSCRGWPFSRYLSTDGQTTLRSSRLCGWREPKGLGDSRVVLILLVIVLLYSSTWNDYTLAVNYGCKFHYLLMHFLAQL